ncbi:MAG: cytochrome d ubiquinol oxidase subunit II [Bacteroidales bacterium]|jgi:cytochrome d ubiquinol oxidase subunit II
MTTLISYVFLQHYWWVIVSLFASLLVFLMFVQGGQSVIFSLPGNATQKTMIINAMGRKWEFTFTTLVTFGGAFFASFPLFYSTSFGGAYWVWIAILFSFIIQAVAYEYRSKPANVLGQKSFDIFLFINGIAGPFLIGTAVGTFFTGSRFRLDAMNDVLWGNGWHGLEALTDGRNVAMGLAVVFLARVNGLLYILNTIDDQDLVKRTVKKLAINSISFLLFFLFFLVTLFSGKGMTIGTGGTMAVEKFKYLHNFISMPFVLVLFFAGVILVLYGIAVTLFKAGRKGIWFSGPGTILAVFALFLVAGFNNSSFYPSAIDPQSSLTIYNASSSLFTLKTMMYVSFLIPFVIAYIWIAWRAINDRKITSGELQEDGHVY